MKGYCELMEKRTARRPESLWRCLAPHPFRHVLLCVPVASQRVVVTNEMEILIDCAETSAVQFFFLVSTGHLICVHYAV